MTSWIKDKRILVTGGAGAFGRRFIKNAHESGAAGVTILSRDEMKHAALRREWAERQKDWIRLMIGDINQPQALALAMRDADLVIHAAAMKHLPECEQNAIASTRVNVVGTLNIVEAFLGSTCSCLVFLSTDKAPYASSVYGAEKYIGEKLVTEAARLGNARQRAFSLRYSNVMDSTGSVFHIFNEQLRANKTAAVNGSQTCRGFVSQASVLSCLDRTLSAARGGEVIVMLPQVVRIAELAQTMREILQQGKVLVTESTGFVGEKESATLVMAEEMPRAKQFPEFVEGGAILLDLLGRHAERAGAAKAGGAPLTLEDCPALSGVELNSFVSNLMEAR